MPCLWMGKSRLEAPSVIDLQQERQEVGGCQEDRWVLSLGVFIYLFIGCFWVFIAACGLFSSCGEQGLLFVAVRRLLIAVASLVAEHGL